MADYSLTVDNVLVFDPFTIRPGEVCHLDISYSFLETVEWDISTIFSQTFNGYIDVASIQSDDIDISLRDISIQYADDTSLVTIAATSDTSDTITVKIYGYRTVTQNNVAISAFPAYYKDYVVVNGVTIPKTAVEIDDIDDEYLIAVTKIVPTFDLVHNNGIVYINGLLATITSSGLFEYNDDRFYVLRKGLQQVSIPQDSDLDAIRIEDGRKIVQIDSQEWQTGYFSAHGMIQYNDKLLLLTNKSLCIFELYGDIQEIVLEDTNICGSDLTYIPDDAIIVARGNTLYKYHIRHNNVWLDNTDKRIYFREIDPGVTVVNS